ETSSVTQAPIGDPGFDLSAIYPGTVVTNLGRPNRLRNPSIARYGLPERKQPASSRGENTVVDPGAVSREQKTSQAVPLATLALERVPVVPYLEVSSGSFAAKTLGALALGVAVLVTCLLLFYFKVGASRQSEDPLGAAVAPVVSPLPSPLVSSPMPASSTSADSLPAADAGSAQSFQTRMLEAKIVRILLDPGHGGHDKGTTGSTGLTEKELCLDVALRLGRIIKQRLPNADVIFTRIRDMFIPLEERTYIANDIKADLFLSIHANSSPYPAARGIETYYLDLAGSTEVMELAARENATAQGPDRLERTKKTGLGEEIEDSRMLDEDLQESLNRFVQHSGSGLESRRVRRAPFVVLAGANMPSVLAEIPCRRN